MGQKKTITIDDLLGTIQKYGDVDPKESALFKELSNKSPIIRNLNHLLIINATYNPSLTVK